jgi:hypothetical protein
LVLRYDTVTRGRSLRTIGTEQILPGQSRYRPTR